MLSKAIQQEVNQRKPSLYSQLRLNTNEWYKRLQNIRIDTCSDNRFWLTFWRGKDVTKPTLEDLEQLKQLREDSLNSIQLVLAVSLKYLIINHCGKTELARNLNEYWLIGNKELKKRGYETLDFNPYDIDMKAVSDNSMLTKQQCFIEGVCPECKSKAFVISNGNMWLCKKCKRNFKKIKSQLHIKN
jgi:hypothetical protein